jgi:DNA repair/transcription protein MET18/MMS19
MSDIQQYLLDFDRNKKEATVTAQRSATRMYETLEGYWWDGG